MIRVLSGGTGYLLFLGGAWGGFFSVAELVFAPEGLDRFLWFFVSLVAASVVFLAVPRTERRADE